MAKKALTIEKESGINGGFNRETMQVTSIVEGAGVNGSLLNKLGTSIPTPFARLHLFSSAFLEVNANPVTAGSNYKKLVSLAFDMLEFLYLNGASSSMKVVKWNVDDQTKILSRSTTKHKNFGNALLSAWNDDGYTGRDIYLFFYKGKLIGGSSPMSLVYTSPNINEKYQGLSHGHLLFDDANPLDFLERELEFRLYVYKLWKTFSNQFANGVIGASINQYITNAYNRDVNVNPQIGTIINQFAALPDMKAELLNPSDHTQPLKEVVVDGGMVALGNGTIQLLVKDLSNVAFYSDYVLKPTSDYYKNYNVNGETKQMRTPLVLNQEGLGGSHYVNETYWISGSIPPADTNIPVYDRILPNTEIKHPYLMASDIMQDKIIELSYDVQKAKFYTGLTHNTKYLVPLKLEFFKYFRPEDFKGMLRIEEELDSITGAVIKVKVLLSIPLENGSTIILSKEYSDESETIVHTFNGEDAFNLAFFPFFIDKALNVKNEYDVMLLNKANSAHLSFFDSKTPDQQFIDKVDDHGTIIGEITFDERSTKGMLDYETKYYHIEKPFDVVEVTVKARGVEGSGLVLPIMKEIDSDTGANQFTFGVDFGTTNTQVAFSENPNANVKTFGISVNSDPQVDESQTVFLNDHEIVNNVHRMSAGFGQIGDTDIVSRQEFLFPDIPASTFPMRTAVCEIDNLNTKTSDQIHTFGSLNIGFNYANELTSDQNVKNRNRYVTNLKWNYSGDTKVFDRIRIFFQELLQMMRNKAVLNNGSRGINVVVTYPQAMNGGDLRNFKDAWRRAADAIGLNRNNIDFQLESIAPYYSFSRSKGLNHIYVNMDIGGGSTDILYFDPQMGGDQMTYSVFFAANDIWGDGCNVLMQGGRNGFLLDYERSQFYTSKPDKYKNEYSRVKDKANDSSNVINFLFKNDNVYDFSQFIKGSKQILLPLLHYTALVYYLSLAVEAHNLSYPKTITFTGMGSKYLNLLGDDCELEKLSNVIMDYAREKTATQLSILFAPNPKEVTAEGAVIIQTALSQGINLIQPESPICYGIVDEEEDTKICIKQIMENDFRKDVISHYEKIVDLMLKNNTFRDMVEQLGLGEALKAIPQKQEFMGILTESFDAYQQIFMRMHKGDNDDTTVKESIFFWPLKNGLYQLGVYLANKNED